MTFSAVRPTFDLPALEKAVQTRWDRLDVLRRALDRNPDGPLFRFYDGPPTANGRPGAHHVAARVFKDVFPRYRAMKGYRVPRRAGWDCHGIPVELEVERELGFTSKKDIEAFGVGRFNDRCRESVTRYVGEFQSLTRRIGYWVDTDNAYWTMSDTYVDSVWWSLKKLFDAGLMYQDHRVTPYCPRCGTSLSDHEVAQGYQDVEDTSVFVRLPVLTGPLAAADGHPGADLLVWTTMPWTFMATTAAVIGPELDYVLADGGRAGTRPVVVAAALVEQALGAGARVVRAVNRGELLGHRYQGPFDYVGPGSRTEPDTDPGSWRIVVASDFVTLEQGSGIVSTGAAFGEEDMAVARANGLPVVNPVTLDGRFDERCGPFAGLGVREADPLIIEQLAATGLLLHAHSYAHSYPFCWRCDTALIYYAKPSWYLATTRYRTEMLADNATVAWQPEHIRSGRYGDWLANNVDWAISRERYWGTPLPLWRCDDADHVFAIGSRAELAARAGRAPEAVDLHRPGVDEVTLTCTECGSPAHRVPDVIDAWYDSGAMPFAQYGYPHLPGSAEQFEPDFPADFICEGIDQTRGWFYSLQAVSTLLFGRSAYSRAQCLGHIVDAAGRKMSKSAGNVIDPWSVIDAHGADALRWLLVSNGNPWQSRQIDEAAVVETVRQSLLTLWNVYYFFITYATGANWRPSGAAVAVEQRTVLDRYILAELATLVGEVDRAYDQFDATAAGRGIATFLDTLSNWYVRLSRARFSRPRAAAATDAAFDTLWRVLCTLTHLLAPITPFLAEDLYVNLVSATVPNAPVSVHLADFPSPVTADRDDELVAAMNDARRLVTLGRNARRTAGIGARQPLPRAAIVLPRDRHATFHLVAESVAAELNVRRCELISSGHRALRRAVKPNFRALGRQFGRQTAALAAALAALDGDAAARELDATGRIVLDAVDGSESSVVITADMLEIVEHPAEGWTQSAADGYAVALDLTVDDDLRREGWARELARGINELRRSTGLQMSATVVLDLRVVDDVDARLAQTLDRHLDTILEEVQAVSGTATDPLSDATFEVAGGRVVATLAPA